MRARRRLCRRLGDGADPSRPPTVAAAPRRRVRAGTGPARGPRRDPFAHPPLLRPGRCDAGNGRQRFSFPSLDAQATRGRSHLYSPAARLAPAIAMWPWLHGLRQAGALRGDARVPELSTARMQCGGRLADSALRKGDLHPAQQHRRVRRSTAARCSLARSPISRRSDVDETSRPVGWSNGVAPCSPRPTWPSRRRHGDTPRRRYAFYPLRGDLTRGYEPSAPLLSWSASSTLDAFGALRRARARRRRTRPRAKLPVLLALFDWLCAARAEGRAERRASLAGSSVGGDAAAGSRSRTASSGFLADH